MADRDLTEAKHIPPPTNGATPMRTLSVLALIINFYLSASFLVMIVEGKENTATSDDDNDYSPSLFVFFFLSVAMWLLSIVDVWVIFKGTTNKLITLPWKFHHKSFFRAAAGVHMQALILFPGLLTYLFHSLGSNYFDFVKQLNGSDRRAFNYHIATFVVAFTSAFFHMVYCWYTIKLGIKKMLVNDQSAEVHSRKLVCASKLLALVTIGGAVSFCVSLVYSCDKHVHSGVVICTVAMFLIALPAVFVNWKLLINSSQRHVEFLMVTRNIMAVYAFVCYISFWVVLLLLVLIGSGDREFFETVNDELTEERKGIFYTHIAVFLVYVVVSGLRFFYHKMRKTLRAGRPQPLALGAPVMHPQSSSSVLTSLPNGSVPPTVAPSRGQVHPEKQSLTAGGRYSSSLDIPSANVVEIRSGGTEDEMQPLTSTQREEKVDIIDEEDHHV